MTVNSDEGTAVGLERLQQVRRLASDFRAREADLEKELRVRGGYGRRSHEQALELLEAALTAEQAQAQAVFWEEEARLEAVFGRRRARITRAREQCERQALERVSNEEADLKFALRKHMRSRELAYPEARKEAERVGVARLEELAARREEAGVLVNALRNALEGYPRLSRLLTAGTGRGGLDAEAPPMAEQQLAMLRRRLEDARAALRAIQGIPQARLFRVLPPPLALTLLALVAAGALALRWPFDLSRGDDLLSLVVVVAAVIGLLLLHQSGRRRITAPAAAAAAAIEQVLVLHDTCLRRIQEEKEQELAELEATITRERDEAEESWNSIQRDADARRQAAEDAVDVKHQRVKGQWESLARRFQARLQSRRDAAEREWRELSAARRHRLEVDHAASDADQVRERETRWRGLGDAWQAALVELSAGLERVRRRVAEFPDWESPAWADWHPPARVPDTVRFAVASLDRDQLEPLLPRDPRLALPPGLALSVPLAVAFPEPGSLLLETGKTGRAQAIAVLNTMIFRLLLASPPGRIAFTLLDPVELGQSFAGFMHLADHEESLINGRIWTQDRQVEQRLADLNEHMEKVIQTYLRTEHRTLDAYNAQAGALAEKYRFLVIADFPAGFTELALGRLLSIAASGARCGVYTLIHWDRRRPLPPSFAADDLRRHGVCLQAQGEGFQLLGSLQEGVNLCLDPPPPAELAVKLLHTIGRSGADAARVEVGFSCVAPTEAERWSLTTEVGLRVPIGRTGATRLQYFALGEGTRQHALVAGKTGSGKSNLLHVIITNLALWCTPREVEFYLIDFKKGVEFKCYASGRLPHARVVAIESEREFGVSVLQRVDQELTRRAERFRQQGVQELAAYRREAGDDPMPRTLLVVDEFQEFFVVDDALSQAAALLLDRLVRQGRAFGIHVLLGSQTLGGAYTVSRSTLGQMVVRIALQCNEADAFLIMDDNNAAPRMLSRPGEAIYNDAAGLLEGNSPFQAVWLPDAERETCVAAVRRLADAREPGRWPGPLVFEGNAPAVLADNPLLESALNATSVAPAPTARVWLGSPNSIKGPTELSFSRQSGSHAIIVGQQEEAQITLLAAALAALAAQHPVGGARFVLLDATPPGAPHRVFLERVAAAIPHGVELPTGARLTATLAELAVELAARRDAERLDTRPAIYVLINGIQRFSKLRYGDGLDFSFGDNKDADPAAQLNQVMIDGGALGCHAIITCDTANNANRFLGRKALAECTMRVLFQMSANDSATLIDSPVAGNLGLHRAVLYNEQAGYTELFRPYGLPGESWIRALATRLARLHGRPAPPAPAG